MSNLTPGKKAKGGTSERLSAYLMPEELARLDAHLTGLTAPQRSKAIARLLSLGLDREDERKGGYAEVTRPDGSTYKRIVGG